MVEQGPPHVPSQTSILNLGFKAATFRVSSGASDVGRAHRNRFGRRPVQCLLAQRVYGLDKHRRGYIERNIIREKRRANHSSKTVQNSLACSAIA